MNYLDIILGVVIIAMLFCSRKLGEEESIFGRNSTASLRGVAMVGIILHHIHNRLGYGSPILSSVGYLATGLFFFISGYGNLFSVRKYEKIKFNWFVKKFLKIYIPFFVVYWFYSIFDYVLYPFEAPKPSEIIVDILTVSLPNQVSWFPKIIILCFLVHWLVKTTLKNEKTQILTTGVLFCGYIVIMYLAGKRIYWFNSILCYPLGMLFAMNKKTIENTFNTNKKRILIFVISIFVFGLAFVGTFVFWGAQLLCALMFSVICFLFTMVLSTNTRALAWIGNNSFEFYLVHIACVQLFCFFVPNQPYIYTLSVILGTIILVYLYLKASMVIKKIVLAEK